MKPEEELAQSLLVAFNGDFAERQASARQLAELLLDAVAAALPLTRHEPAEGPLRELEALAPQVDVYAWEGAPGWDEILARGLAERAPMEAGAPLLDGLGARREEQPGGPRGPLDERTRQRGELKRRAQAQAARLVQLAREAARFAADPTHEGAAVLDVAPTLPAPAAVVAAHATLLRLVGLSSAASLLLPNDEPDAGELPPPSGAALAAELEQRGGGFPHAQDEWLALLLSRNPAVADLPAFRTFYAGLSQCLRAAPALLRFRDDARNGQLAGEPEALLAAVTSWQPIRWQTLRGGAPTRWLRDLCPPAPPDEPPLQRLARECDGALDLFGRLWFAERLPPVAFTSLAALFTARCAGILALWQELGGGQTAR